MRLKCRVVNVHADPNKKNPEEKYYRAVCFDQDADHPMDNTVDYNMRREEVEDWGGLALKGKVIELGVTEITSGFNGRMRLRGSILTTPPAPKV